MVAFTQGGKGQIVSVDINTIVEKHTLNPEITRLCQFHAQKALFKVPKFCKFGTATRPLSGTREEGGPPRTN